MINIEAPQVALAKGKDAVRAQLIRAAAEALLLDADVAVQIAGVASAAFVQTTRQTYKAHGFSFSDDDIRAIHETVRGLVIRRGLHRQVLTPEDRKFNAEMRRVLDRDKRPTGPRLVTTTPGGRKVED